GQHPNRYFLPLVVNLSRPGTDTYANRACGLNRNLTGFTQKPAAARTERKGRGVMIVSKIIRGVAAVAVAAVALTAFASKSQAVGNFDGKWSVLIVTTKGDCDRAYRYPISISGQTLINAGSTSFDISGNVQSNGAVK